MSARVSTACAVIVVALSLAGVALTAVTDDADTFAVVGLPFALIGALLLFRRAGHRIAWVLSAIGVLVCTGSTSATVAAARVEGGGPPDALTIALAWYGEWYWLPFLYLTLAGLPVLLPTGTLPSAAARRLWRVIVGCMAVATTTAMFQGMLLADDVAEPIENPIGWLGYDDVDHTSLVTVIVGVVVVLGGLAVAGVVRRLRRASGVERQQLKVVPSAAFDLQSDLLVAAATLVAAAVFVPVRVRVQAAVDRRFNRARYDAALVVEQFAARLRHDVDLGALVRDLGDTVATTMQPAHVSLWVPDRQSIR